MKVFYTDEEIINCIKCEKTFLNKPPKIKIVNKNYSQKFDIFSTDNNEKFTVFITFSSRMNSDFSVGLLYDEYLLFRCNGFHGTTRSGFYSHPHHACAHTHTLTIEDIQKSRSKKPSKILNIMNQYWDLSSCVLYFFQECGIIGYEKYFDLKQISLL